MERLQRTRVAIPQSRFLHFAFTRAEYPTSECAGRAARVPRNPLAMFRRRTARESPWFGLHSGTRPIWPLLPPFHPIAPNIRT